MGDNKRKAYLFLGLGIGIIFVNIIFYMNPRVKYREMTDTEVASKAKELGMVSIKENIKIDDNKEVKSEKEEKSVKEEESKELFIIKEGESLYDVSENLLKYGYIEDDKKFNDRVKERELSKKIRYGEYDLSEKASFDEIINVITWRDKK